MAISNGGDAVDESTQMTGASPPPAPAPTSGASGGSAPTQTLYPVVITKGQTTIPLPVTANTLADVGLIINGVEYLPPDIKVNTANVVWQGSFGLDPATDTVFVRYI